jgi:hypothetical protein
VSDNSTPEDDTDVIVPDLASDIRVVAALYLHDKGFRLLRIRRNQRLLAAAVALDSLRESVKGCGAIFEWGACVCGDAGAWLCDPCVAKRDRAIAQLLGSTTQSEGAKE